jgi:hypothetical protein
LGQFSIDRFPNQEVHAVIQTDVVNEECIILGTIAPPDEQLLSTLLLSHTLKKEGARNIIALLPYLAYARDDKQKKGQSIATAWVGALLQASGVDEVITVDVHSPTAQRLLPMPVVSLSPEDLFAQAMKRLSLLNETIVAPDEGARDRCQEGIGTLLMDLLTQEEDAAYGTRFDIDLLTDRLLLATHWLQAQAGTKRLVIGYFGASTGAAAAFNAAAAIGSSIGVMVSRGGRPDLAEEALVRVQSPTLLIVGATTRLSSN